MISKLKQFKQVWIKIAEDESRKDIFSLINFLLIPLKFTKSELN